MKSAAFLLVVLVASSPLVHALPRQNFQIAPLSSFNGSSWNGLVLGQTTFKDVRARFQTGDGAFARSTELSQPKNSPIRVDLLWSKRGRDEVLTAIALRYRSGAPTSEDVWAAFDPDKTGSEWLYLRGRFSDWRVMRCALRGVAAFALQTDDFNGVPLLMLCAPSTLNRLNVRLTNQRTDVVERIDPHANEAKIALFGSVNIEADFEDDLNFPDSARRELRSDLRDATAGGALEYRSGSLGSYDVTLKGTGSQEEGGSISAKIVISATGPYGPIQTTGSSTSSWSRPTTDSERRREHAPIAFEKAVREARRQAETRFAQAMEASGPPSLAAIREAQWGELVALLREDSGLNVVRTAPLGF